MRTESPRRRVLVAADASAVFSLRDLFARTPLDTWEPVEADSFTRARFVMQHHPCEVVLVNDDLHACEADRNLNWLTRPHPAPVIMLAGNRAGAMAQAYRQGA